MVVWQPETVRTASRLHRNGWTVIERSGGRACAGSALWNAQAGRTPRVRAISKGMRTGLEYLLAILGALASSYLILRLGL